ARATSTQLRFCKLDTVKLTLALINGEWSGRSDVNSAEIVRNLQSTMWDGVGPFRTKAKLLQAIARLGDMERQIANCRRLAARNSICSGSNVSTCVTCCSWRAQWRKLRCDGPRVAARINARIFRYSPRNGT